MVRAIGGGFKTRMNREHGFRGGQCLLCIWTKAHVDNRGS